jgi:O-antigen ligase
LIGSATEHRPAAGDQLRDRGEGRSSEDTSARQRVSPELLALAALFLLTAAFGRSFSKLELGPSWLHPTEVVLAAVLVVALARTKPADALRRIRATGAVVPLLVLWLFGAIAALRGLSGWGFSKTLEDIGLIEYSVLVPLLALVVRSRFELFWLSRVVGLAGVLAITAQAAELWAPSSWDLAARLELIEVASGMYVGIFAAWVAARVAAGFRPPAWHYAVLVLGIGMTVAAGSRAVWVGMLVGFAVVIALTPSSRRLASTGFVAAMILLGTVFSVPIRETTVGGGAPRVVSEVQQSFGDAPANANARWRIAYWKFVLEESIRTPAVGIGFGKPAHFRWSGIIYDARTGDPVYPFDVTPPHNSFLNLLYRTGVPGLLALAALMFVAARRLLPVTRRAQDQDKALAVFLLVALATITAIACFAVVLEGPYMGIFFWGVLGLALLAPLMLNSEDTSASEESEAHARANSARTAP